MNLNPHVYSHIFGPCSVSVNTYSLCVEILKYDIDGTVVSLLRKFVIPSGVKSIFKLYLLTAKVK